MQKEIERFKLEGNIYIWKYSPQLSNFPGWNMSIDREARKNLPALLDLMQKSEWPSKKALPTAIPTTQPLLPVRGNSWKTKSEILLNYKKEHGADYWQTIANENTLEIRFGSNKLVEFINSIQRLQSGINDFAIGDENEENILYFW